MYILLVTMLSMALAEPPISKGYSSAARSGQDHKQYLPPDLRSNNREISQEYGPPEFRGVSQGYGASSFNDASGFGNSLSQEYGPPAVRFSQEYNSFGSELKEEVLGNIPSNVYGVPAQRSSPATQYGLPELRSVPSKEYGTPSLKSSGLNNRNPSPVQKYGVPRFHSTQSRSGLLSEYGTPSTKSNTPQGYEKSLGFGTQSLSHGTRKSPSQIYGAPGRSLLTQYGAPQARNTLSQSQVLSRNLPPTYGTPAVRTPSQEYGAPETRTTNAFASSYTARSPSQEYGLPISRAAMPAQHYGAPRNNVALSDQGYQYSRKNLDLLNQEPASYEFAYKVSDYESGSDFGHTESRQDDRAEGSYFVLLPDGSKQIVEYEADEDGFKPRISVEPADTSNALSADGPY